MKLDKKQIRAISVFAIILIVYNVLAFAIPFTHTGLFWVGYVFGLISIIVGMLIVALAFSKAETHKSRLYGFPVARLGVIYAALQLPLSFFVMMLARLEIVKTWPFTVLFIVILAAVLLGTAGTDLARDEVERQDTAHAADVSAMKGLRTLSGGLVEMCGDPAAKKELEKLADAFKYSDPVSNAATADAETELKNVLNAIGTALGEKDFEKTVSLAGEASTLLARRNAICKLNK